MEKFFFGLNRAGQEHQVLVVGKSSRMNFQNPVFGEVHVRLESVLLGISSASDKRLFSGQFPRGLLFYFLCFHLLALLRLLCDESLFPLHSENLVYGEVLFWLESLLFGASSASG